MFGPTCEANLEPYDPDVVICWHLAYNRDITGYYIYISITLQPIVTNINQYVTHVVCGFVCIWAMHQIAFLRGHVMRFWRFLSSDTPIWPYGHV